MESGCICPKRIILGLDLFFETVPCVYKGKVPTRRLKTEGGAHSGNKKGGGLTNGAL